MATVVPQEEGGVVTDLVALAVLVVVGCAWFGMAAGVERL
jgi:hypothetical protein